MRLKINLATQPYEDARRFMISWSSIIGVLVLLLVVLTYGVVKHWQHYRQMSQDLNRERQILADMDQKQKQGMAILNESSNRDVREKSEFINELIRRKEASWTTIFSDLEQLMPSNLRVLAVAPRLQQDKIMIQMQLGGESRERAAELARRMERSNVFRDAQIVSESNGTAEIQAQPRGPAPTDPWRFEMIAEYIPGVALAKPEQPKGSNEADQGSGR